jgi:hypothetical protein
MPETWHFAVGGTCFCIVLIVSIILIAVSFSTLEPNEVGLDVNANTMYLDTGKSTTKKKKKKKSKKKKKKKKKKKVFN